VGLHTILPTNNGPNKQNLAVPLGRKMRITTYTTMNDLIMHDKSLKCAPITDTLGFLTAIANTYALAQVLFTYT